MRDSAKCREDAEEPGAAPEGDRHDDREFQDEDEGHHPAARPEGAQSRPGEEQQ